MKLSRVEIRNFRSIENVTINFDPRCRVLVGINEAGKSNILKALALLSPDKVPTKQDIREVLPDDPPITEARISFIFSLEDEDTKKIIDAVRSKTLGSQNIPIIQRQKQSIHLDEFCRSRNEGLFGVNLLTGVKAPNYFSLQGECAVLPQWKKPSPQCPPTYIAEGSSAALSTFSFVNTTEFHGIPTDHLADLTAEEINAVIGAQIKEVIKAGLPQVIYWSYEEKYLLPAQINLTQFSANPSICIPLSYMFELADITAIPKSIADAKASSSTGIRNLLNRVATQTTKHLHSVWKEHKKVRIQLIPDGDFIAASVQEGELNHYEFAKRSDGFKRFVTFLLMISSRVKTRALSNALLLVDEPDMGLHPSGARYLCDELIRISKANDVVYSTHSIFMIDREKIDRHLIVTKTNEVTATKDVNESNIVDEEVIYNALGSTIFESLRERNILFEGWRDKHLFQIAIKKLPKTQKHITKAFSEVGICHAKGVKDIRHITPLLQLANRRCLIISDDDGPAKEKQKTHIAEKGYGDWLTYGELMPTANIVTSEDFLKPEAFRSIVDKVQNMHPALPKFDLTSLNDTRGKLHALRSWLGKEKSETFLNVIKEGVFNILEPDHIEPSYYHFLENLAQRLN